MDVPLRGQNVLIIGATGMVGGCALEIALGDPAVKAVTVIGRRSVGRTDAKLSEYIHSDLLNYGYVLEALDAVDVALFCLGVYSGTVSDEYLRLATVDYAVSFAKALHGRSPQAAVCFLSGQGADPSGRSRFAFARYKGVAETALLETGFNRVHIFRPGYIYPVLPREEPNVAYRVFRAVYPLARRLYPNIGIASTSLARVMLEIGLNGNAGQSSVMENRDIRRACASLAKT